MDKFHNSLTQTHLNWWRFLPYAVFGILAFSLTSAIPLHSLFKSYLMFLEIPVGLMVLYLGIPKIVNRKNKHR